MVICAVSLALWSVILTAHGLITDRQGDTSAAIWWAALTVTLGIAGLMLRMIRTDTLRIAVIAVPLALSIGALTGCVVLLSGYGAGLI